MNRYPDELFATVWVGQEPDEEMRAHVAELEADLEARGTPCTILVKNETTLPHGGRYRLWTKDGEFQYRIYRLDPIGDEDWVVVASLNRGDETYRFRVSLTRTLTSMLRGRGLLKEGLIHEVYLREIERRLQAGDVPPEVLNEVMFGSRDLSRFSAQADHA